MYLLFPLLPHFSLSLSLADLWAQSVVGLECRWVLKAPSTSSISALSPCPFPQGPALRILPQVTQPLGYQYKGDSMGAKTPSTQDKPDHNIMAIVRGLLHSDEDHQVHTAS